MFQGGAAIILDVYKKGAIVKDGRLKVGDQILECNGVHITKVMTHERVCLSIKQRAAKVWIIIIYLLEISKNFTFTKSYRITLKQNRPLYRQHFSLQKSG